MQKVSRSENDNITKTVKTYKGYCGSAFFLQLRSSYPRNIIMKKVLKFSLVIIVLVCSSWGYLVHRTINQVAIYQLPKAMRPFFYENKDSIARNAPRPDQRRSTDTTEFPKHFVDLEAFGDSAGWKMPVKWEDALKQYGKDSLRKYGFLPYVVADVQSKLTNAFRLRNKDSIIFYATDLGHYIGDAHVPLHTSINYDGQLSNQRGIHDLWETSTPEAVLEQYTLYNGHEAKYISDTEQATWETIRSSHALLGEMFAAEKEVSKNFTDSTKYFKQVRWGRERRFYTKAFAIEYNKVLAASINKQLLLSANQIADFWYTAWVDAGSPDLSQLMLKPFGKPEKRKVKSECKAYRKGDLIERNLLLSKQEKEN